MVAEDDGPPLSIQVNEQPIFAVCDIVAEKMTATRAFVYGIVIENWNERESFEIVFQALIRLRCDTQTRQTC